MCIVCRFVCSVEIYIRLFFLDSVHVRLHVNICMNIRTHICTYAHMEGEDRHTCMYVHTHTHTQRERERERERERSHRHTPTHACTHTHTLEIVSSIVIAGSLTEVVGAESQGSCSIGLGIPLAIALILLASSVIGNVILTWYIMIQKRKRSKGD